MALNFRKFLEGIKIVPKSSSTASEKGDIDVTSGDGKLNYHNGTSSSPVVTENHQATLENKTLTNPTIDNINGVSGSGFSITADADVLINVDLGNFSATTTNGGGVFISSDESAGGSFQYNNGTSSSAVVTESHSATLTNKTLTTPIVNTSITGGASDQLTVQSASNQNLLLRSLGTGDVNIRTDGSGSTNIEDVIFNNTAISSFEQDLSLSSDVDLYLQAGSSVYINPFYNTVVLGRLLIVAPPVFYVKQTITSSGSNVLLPVLTSSYAELTNSSLVSIDTIPVGNSGQFVVIMNLTGNSIIINNDTGGAFPERRILTGTGGSVSLPNKGSATLFYSITDNRWHIVSLTQVSSIPTPSITTISANTSLTSSNDIVLVNGTTVTVTLPNPTTLSPGKTFDIKKISATGNVVTINTVSGTIDGDASKTIPTQYHSLRITTNGVNYFLI